MCVLLFSKQFSYPTETFHSATHEQTAHTTTYATQTWKKKKVSWISPLCLFVPTPPHHFVCLIDLMARNKTTYGLQPLLFTARNMGRGWIPATRESSGAGCTNATPISSSCHKDNSHSDLKGFSLQLRLSFFPHLSSWRVADRTYHQSFLPCTSPYRGERCPISRNRNY